MTNSAAAQTTTVALTMGEVYRLTEGGTYLQAEAAWNASPEGSQQAIDAHRVLTAWRIRSFKERRHEWVFVPTGG